MDALAKKNNNKQQTLECMVQTHSIMVRRIAYHLMGRLPSCIQLDDLIQAGMLGLMEAALHYDEEKGASFETYAGIRIRGHMLDEVRRNDWVPRSVYRNARLIAEAVKRLENELGRDARDCEIAEALNISLSEYHDMVHDFSVCQILGFEDLGVTDDVIKDFDEKSLAEPHQNAIKANLKQHIHGMLDNLPSKEHIVLCLYYEQDLNLKEIGAVLDVSESRVSQLHAQAIKRIKSQMNDQSYF